MLRHRLSLSTFAGVVVIAALVKSAPVLAQAGVVLSGAGPVNRSMAGASTAAPIDATGALYWNPASISGLLQSEMAFGLEVLYPHTTLSSSVPSNALGLGLPPTATAGSDDSDAGVFPLPSFGLVYRPECSPWTFGLGVVTEGGFGVNYPGSATNPILQAPPLIGLGVGPLFSQLAVTEVTPTVAYQLTERLSVGIAPVVTLASLTFDPNLVAPPDHPGGTAFASYPRSAHSPVRAGGGFQAGVYYVEPDGWHFGASIKSTQWLENFEFNSMNARGQPTLVPFFVDFPMIASIGVAYTGFSRWVVATDLRYIDYANTAGFRRNGFGPTGGVQGLGWRSIFAVAAGAQYQCTDDLSLRLGYSYNQSPLAGLLGVVNPAATINSAAPSVIEHTAYTGASWRFTNALIVSATYAHGFENSFNGIYRGPVVTIPGSNVRSTASADTFIAGLTVQF